jgi:hypothetical protein
MAMHMATRIVRATYDGFFERPKIALRVSNAYIILYACMQQFMGGGKW